MLWKVSVVLCFVAAVLTLGFVLPGQYLRLTTPAEYSLLLLLIGPYALTGWLAWFSRSGRRQTAALLVFTTLLILMGLSFIGLESSHYRSAAAIHPATNERYQRVAVFLVPVVQWLMALLATVAVLAQSFLDRRKQAL